MTITDEPNTDSPTDKGRTEPVIVQNIHHGRVIVACTPYGPVYDMAKTVAVLIDSPDSTGVSFDGYPDDVRRVLTEALAALDAIVTETAINDAIRTLQGRGIDGVVGATGETADGTPAVVIAGPDSDAEAGKAWLASTAKAVLDVWEPEYAVWDDGDFVGVEVPVGEVAVVLSLPRAFFGVEPAYEISRLVAS